MNLDIGIGGIVMIYMMYDMYDCMTCTYVHIYICIYVHILSYYIYTIYTFLRKC